MLLTRNRFITLADTPTSYSGGSNQIARVNSTEDALEFAAASALGVAHADLSGVTAAQHHAPAKALLFDIGGDNWHLPGWFAVDQNAIATLGLDFVVYTPIYVDRTKTYTVMGVRVQTASPAGTVVRLGIYAGTFDGDGQLIPGALELDAGTVLVDSTGSKSIVISQILSQGYHFIAISCDASTQMRELDETLGFAGPVTNYAPILLNPLMTAFGVAVADGAAALVDPAPTPTTIISDTGTWIRLQD